MIEDTDPSAPTVDYDSPWKEAVEHHFQDFLAFYFPEAHTGVDWTRGHRFLDQELAQAVQDAALGRRYVDKLAAVHRHQGIKDWVYIHIEIQGGHDNTFAKRMFTYNDRLFDRYDRPIGSLAVLADDSRTWRPDSYSYEVFGCRHGFAYPLVKLVDYAPRLEALLEDHNPFALVTAAHLLTRQTRGDVTQRYAAKWRLARLLYERDWDRQRIIDLFAVIDWMMRLPAELEAQLWQALTTLERNKHMRYVTSVERIGYARGHQEGLAEGRRVEAIALVRKQLARRLGELPPVLDRRLEDLSVDEVEALSEALLDFSAIGDLEQWLAQP
ncbi:DUF4351 domain-containing protein [Thiorhodococcus minor]|uniref:DUF4351 domain-containing protein n=1 Tax=Thiorhodococcus minor TaxID=57489 RepID=A0A6M0JSB0_9GAMM|nr:DUF4351 domain-containing protein [Thiorhodococcus minor]NEV60406.1 DUF4351 domain-containing protein [Thiorhodococcus minor]